MRPKSYSVRREGCHDCAFAAFAGTELSCFHGEDVEIKEIYCARVAGVEADCGRYISPDGFCEEYRQEDLPNLEDLVAELKGVARS